MGRNSETASSIGGQDTDQSARGKDRVRGGGFKTSNKHMSEYKS